jgi:pimeloyl-ACP methyl ester carboxylesterase
MVRVNGTEVFYEAKGDGDPLLLIAGFGCDHTIWARVVPPLAERYRVIAVDPRGVGQTSGADTFGTIRELADDAAGLIEAIGLGPVHVAGHSMGGLIAQELALGYPERVRTLMVFSSCARLDARGKAIIESWGELPRQVDAVTATRLILPWIYTSDFFANSEAMDQVIELILANPFPPGVEALYRQSRAISSCDTLGRLGAINCPTMVLVGRDDILLPIAFAEQLAAGIRGAELVVLGRAGHGLLIESPRAVATAMIEFLSRHVRAG